MASNMCLDERLDIRAAITNPAADFDEGAAKSVSPFTVECAQTASEESGCFTGRKKRLGWNHCGLVCHCQTKSGVPRQFMAGAKSVNVQIKCSFCLGLWS
jgi:hypothetical protein